jgi:hypothetical protein
MFKNLKLAFVAASLLFVGSAAAQPTDDDGGDRPAQKRDGKGGDRRAKRMAKWDTNKDGKLDEAEKKAMFKARFDKADKNKDGVLSFEEAQTLMKRGLGGHGGKHGPKQP